MKLAGVDLAWQSDKNPTAIAFGTLKGTVLTVTSIEPALSGIDNVFKSLQKSKPYGVAIDAPLIINNSKGQRSCETEAGKVYGSSGASCHTSNITLYPDAKSVYLSERLLSSGFNHIQGDCWQIECYPHPTIIEIFNLPQRLKYKKGRVAEKRNGQKRLAALLSNLRNSEILQLVIKDSEKHILSELDIDSLRGKALKSNEDALDALICLYTAGLYALGHKGQLFGDVTSGYIWIPQGAGIEEKLAE